jgi:predicted flap endonuclease-1-like 5' DNA nuclease
MYDKKISIENRDLLLGVYNDDHKLLNAVQKLKAKGVEVLDCYTPFPVHGLDRAMGLHRTNLTVGAFIAGMLGTISGFSLATYMNVVDWPMIIGGKPNTLKMFTSFIPVMFELTILFTAFGIGIMFFMRSRMIHGIKEDILDVRQTDDLMLVAVDLTDINGNRKEIIDTMTAEGAVEIRENHKGENVALGAAPTPPAEKPVEKVVLSESEKQERLDLIKSTLGEVTDPTTKDDLKRISGIGPVYEKTLNSIGIYTFEQVSKMDAATIKAVEEITNYFPGRIQRDDWMGQAKKFMNE